MINDPGCDHETTFEPTVRAHRRSPSLPLLLSSCKARWSKNSCFPIFISSTKKASLTSCSNFPISWQRQACLLLFCCVLFCLVLAWAWAPQKLYSPRKATLCKELLQTVSKVDSGFSQFRFSDVCYSSLNTHQRLYFQGPHNLGAVPGHESPEQNSR